MRTNTEIVNNIDMTGNDLTIKAWVNRGTDGRRQELTLSVSEESWDTLIEIEQNEYIREVLTERLGVEMIGFGYQVQA